MSRTPATRWIMSAALGAIGLWLALVWRGPIVNDVGWQMWIAARLNAGAVLYVDILEINPPLWFWIGAGIEALARAAGLGAVHGLLLFLGIVAAASVAGSLSLVDGARDKAAVAAALILFLAVSSLYALGQREQFAFLAVAPSILLAARRAEAGPVPSSLALLVGALAASGLLLKPYFLLVPLALEAWLLLRTRHLRPRPELVALVAAGVLYGAAILFFSPAYLTHMVPLIHAAYHGYDSSAAALLLKPALLAPLLALAGVLVAWPDRRPAAVSAALLAGAAFLGAGLWQAKGFAYHFLPALGCAVLAIALSVSALRRARPPAVGAVLIALLLVSLTVAREPARSDHAAAAATADLPRGSTILMLSVSGSAAWPLVQERGFVWPSRHMTHWMLAAVWLAQKEGRADPDLDRLGRSVVAEAAADIERARPAVLPFDRRYEVLAPGGTVGFFSSQPAFATALRAYRRERDVGTLAVYRRVAP